MEGWSRLCELSCIAAYPQKIKPVKASRSMRSEKR